MAQLESIPAYRSRCGFIRRGVRSDFSAARWAWAVLASAVALALALGPAPAARASAKAGKLLAKGTNTKGLIAVASGTAKAPVGKLSFTVSVRPAQAVSVNWLLLCQRGSTPDPGAGTPTTSSEGSFKGRAPLTRALELPSGKLKNCVISVYSSLSSRGKETVEIRES